MKEGVLGIRDGLIEVLGRFLQLWCGCEESEFEVWRQQGPVKQEDGTQRPAKLAMVGLQGAILAHWGCYNEVPEAGWLASRRKLLLKVLEAGKYKASTAASLGDSPLRGCRPPSCLHVLEGMRELPGVSYKDSSPIHEGSS